MGLLAKTAAVLAILAMPVSCVRFELGDGDEADVDVSSNALRISGQDSVVLCPLSASLEASGSVSVVWAGYPAADDRLQLMHARISSRGLLIQEPRGLALLPDELALVSIDVSDSGQEVRAVPRDGSETLRIDLAESGMVEAVLRDAPDAAELDGALEALSESRCEAEVFTPDARLQVLRTHVDGELPLFVESFSL